ncbi:MAG: hypothetical protein ABJ308_02250 [Halieaceae bacterium]
MAEEITVRTSEPGWLQQLAQAYQGHQEVLVVDDAGIGVDPVNQSLLTMGREAGFSRREWAGVLVSLGMSGFGLWMVVAAIVSPEPTSKLGLLVAGGSVLLLSGGFSAIRILTDRRPPVVEVTRMGIRISWE